MDAAAWANLAVAGATLVLAILMWRMVKATKDAVRLGQSEIELTRQALGVSKEQAQLTRAAVDASERQGLEAARSRVDASAPRVAVVIGEPEWPPYTHQPWMEGAARADEGTMFTLPGEASERLWFRTEMLLRNEGLTTAMVVGVQKGEHADDLRFASTSQQFPPPSPDERWQVPRRFATDRWSLAPGETALVVLDSSKSVGEFATAWTTRHSAPPESKMYMELTATDHQKYGIIDNTQIIAGITAPRCREQCWRLDD